MESSPSNAEKLARLAELENDLQRALEVEKLEAMAEFAAGAGHEINNPLTVIFGRAQLLLREEADPERRRSLALIGAQAMRIHEMIADMMLYARPPRPELERVELIGLVDDVIAGLRPRCEEQETAIRRVDSSGPIDVEADPVQLQVALRAVCQNAIEALQSGGHIEIHLECGDSSPLSGERKGDRPPLCDDQRFASVPASGPFRERGPVPLSPGEKTGLGSQRSDKESGNESPQSNKESGNELPQSKEVRIHVRDDGPGLKPEERRHLFDPFYSARQAGRGLGFGLSKAWRIVTNHGGRIEVAGQTGEGAVFTLILPMTATAYGP